ncbi:hypothetical protein ACFQU2_16545 [Siccirubricoccus deserti]
MRRTPGLDGSALRFKSIAALRRHCQENGIEIAGDLHGCPGSKAFRGPEAASCSPTSWVYADEAAASPCL